MNDYKELPKVNIVLRWIASFVIWALGWKLEGKPPDIPKVVFIGGPHTANWDVFLMLMMSWKLQIKMSWLAASDLKFPLNIFSRITNGIPVDRNNPNSNTVQQVIDHFNRVEKVALMIAPEGRLRRVEYWGSGFYYIALGAGVPIVPGYMDYAKKTMGLGEGFFPSGDIEADMEKLANFYSGRVARYPEKVGPVQVRVRTKKMQDRLNARALYNQPNEALPPESEKDQASKN